MLPSSTGKGHSVVFHHQPLYSQTAAILRQRKVTADFSSASLLKNCVCRTYRRLARLVGKLNILSHPPPSCQRVMYLTRRGSSPRQHSGGCTWAFSGRRWRSGCSRGQEPDQGDLQSRHIQNKAVVGLRSTSTWRKTYLWAFSNLTSSWICCPLLVILGSLRLPSWVKVFSFGAINRVSGN